MKNIKEILRGDDSVSLEFISKKAKGLLTFIEGYFMLDKSLAVNGNIAVTGDIIGGDVSITDLEDRITALESAVSTLESDYITLEARVTALETP